jgi:hypothetical protein
MQNYSLYLLWLPKYFDEYYNVENEQEETPFLSNLRKFLEKNEKIEESKLKIYDKRIPPNLKNSDTFINFYHEKESIGYWGKIEFKFKDSRRIGEVIFNEFGFYYFEFTNVEEEYSSNQVKSDKKFIETFFSKENSYPLLSETQEDVLKETFLNDHLDHKTFNRRESKDEKNIRLEDFILEACYEATEDDVNFNSIAIQDKIFKLQEYQYEIKKDEYYTFKSLSHYKTEDNFKTLFQKFNKTNKLDSNTQKKIILDCYEEQAISKFLNTVVSANYFDRITKSIKEVREGLTGKIIFMTPQETASIDSRYKNNEVFQKWSEEKVENYIQLLISKKPLFIKIDNALKSAYYITIGNVSSLGRINDKEDISQLLYYNEWKSLLGYFLETTRSLNEILHLYHSNRTYSELEEIKHYESNNHDKEDIESLIKSNENKLGINEDSKFFVMIIAIIATILVALPDAIGSIGTLKDYFSDTATSDIKKSEAWSKAIFTSLWIYGGLVLAIILVFWNKFFRFMKFLIKLFYYWIIGFFKKFSVTAPDDFDILEHRSNMPIKTFSPKSNNEGYFKKVLLTYQEHESTHRFVHYIEKLNILSAKCDTENSDAVRYSVLPEIVTLENLWDKNPRIYRHLKKHRTTKFSVNRVDKAKVKVTMRYRINRIKINDFFEYYAEMDSYINFYKDYCATDTDSNKRCQKINSPEVIEQLKKDFRGIDAEFSFVGIYSFSLISKTLDHNHEKQFFLYKNSFRVYFHVDKYPIDYYKKEFSLRNSFGKKIKLKPYDAISEMVYLVFLGRLKGFNRDMGKERNSGRDNIENLPTI